MNLKVKKDEYMGGFGSRKSKGEMMQKYYKLRTKSKKKSHVK